MMDSVLEDDTDVGQLIEGQKHKPARIRAGKGRVEASGRRGSEPSRAEQKMKQIAAKIGVRLYVRTYTRTPRMRTQACLPNSTQDDGTFGAASQPLITLSQEA